MVSVVFPIDDQPAALRLTFFLYLSNKTDQPNLTA